MRRGQAGEPSNGNRTQVKSLIVNGDDFGYSREVNAGIIRAHREGILTSTSLMVAEAARDEAAALAPQLIDLPFKFGAVRESPVATLETIAHPLIKPRRTP